jgi:hypothetical protein
LASTRAIATRCFHAARKLVRIGVGEAVEPDHRDKPRDDPVDLRPLHAARGGAKADIAADGEPREQAVILKHHAAIGAGPGDPAAVHQHLAIARRLEPGDHPQQGGLAATRGADQADELAAADLEVDRAQRLDFAAGGDKPLVARGHLPGRAALPVVAGDAQPPQMASSRRPTCSPDGVSRRSDIAAIRAVSVQMEPCVPAPTHLQLTLQVPPPWSRGRVGEGAGIDTGDPT